MTGVRPIIPNLHRPRPGAGFAAVVGTVMLVLVLLIAATALHRHGCGHSVYENKPLCSSHRTGD
jgi:hypothetical protein